MMRAKVGRIGFLASASILVVGASAVRAQPATGPVATAASDADIADIIVTARRANESYLNVPTLVSVQTSEQLARTNANDLSKIAENIPFVQITKTSSGSGGAFVVRGIGSFGTDVGISQPVLLNQDNVFVGRPRIIAQGQYDIAQVEVLKGPQALFYGKNSPAGVISITSKDPGRELEGYVRASNEFKADERILEGAISVPIGETLGVRFAGRAAGMKGYLKNNSVGYAANPVAAAPGAAYLAAFPVPGSRTGRSPDTDDLSGRVTMVWTPTTGFKAKLKYAYGLSHSDGDNSTNEVLCDRTRTSTVSSFGINDVQSDCSFNRQRTNSGFPVGLTVNYPYANGGVPYATTQSHLVSLNLDYTGDAFALSSITGYYKLKYKGAQNAYHDGLGVNWAAQTEDADGFSQEFRLTTDLDSAFNFVAGTYYGRLTQSNQSFSYIANLNINPANGSYYSYQRVIDQKTRTLSGFAQVRWSIAEAIELDAGARYTEEKKSDVSGNAYVHPAFVASVRAAGDLFNRRRRDTDFSPEVTLTWKPSVGQILFASYKEGFKSGGYSAPPVLTRSFTDASTTFNPERARGFEIGYKGELLDRLLRLELTAYRYNYSSQQVSVFVPASLGFLVTNAGKSRVQGIEGSVYVKPAAGLTLNASLGYNDAYFLSYLGAACYTSQTAATGCVPTGVGASVAQNLSGRTIPRAPKLAGGFGVTYGMPVDDTVKLTFNVGGSYSGRYNASDNLDPFLVQGNYFRLNAGVSVATIDDKFELSLIGRNLTNQYNLQYAQDKARGRPGEYLGYGNRTREIAVQGTMRF